MFARLVMCLTVRYTIVADSFRSMGSRVVASPTFEYLYVVLCEDPVRDGLGGSNMFSSFLTPPALRLLPLIGMLLDRPRESG